MARFFNKVIENRVDLQSIFQQYEEKTGLKELEPEAFRFLVKRIDREIAY